MVFEELLFVKSDLKNVTFVSSCRNTLRHVKVKLDQEEIFLVIDNLPCYTKILRTVVIRIKRNDMYIQTRNLNAIYIDRAIIDSGKVIQIL